ncbi:YHYH domain-containing protein [Zoogloea sp.]|uniref:YHYH domain-containing protein n=1 Tax=Zoogloea sp. TaxID=49181 RepID=UPI0035B3AB6D
MGTFQKGIRRWAALAAVFVPASSVWAHGGGLNAEGCHFNRRTGDYHCHRSGYSPPRYVAPTPTVQPLYSPQARGVTRSTEAGASCVQEAAAERASCLDRRRADRERIAELEQTIRDLKGQTESLQAEVNRLWKERQGYFP